MYELDQKYRQPILYMRWVKCQINSTAGFRQTYIVLQSVCMNLTRNTDNQYYICDGSSANPQMQPWKNKMLKSCVIGQRNDSVGRTIGFDVDGEKKFGHILFRISKIWIFMANLSFYSTWCRTAANTYWWN